METEQKLNRHQRRRIRTRIKLQRACLELLLEKGYDDVSIQDITDRADLGRGTFYIHFKDKVELVWSIIKDGMQSAEDAAQEAMGGKLPEYPEHMGYLNMFRHAAQNKDLYRVMLGSKGSAVLTTRVQDFMAADLESEMEEYGVYSQFNAPSSVVAQIITGAIVRLIIWWLEQGEPYPVEEMADMIYETIHHQVMPRQ